MMRDLLSILIIWGGVATWKRSSPEQESHGQMVLSGLLWKDVTSIHWLWVLCFFGRFFFFHHSLLTIYYMTVCEEWGGDSIYMHACNVLTWHYNYFIIQSLYPCFCWKNAVIALLTRIPVPEQLEQLYQKMEKRERTIQCVVVESYSGQLFPCTKGCKVACCVPCTDEPRITLTPGDRVLVTRWKK